MVSTSFPTNETLCDTLESGTSFGLCQIEYINDHLLERYSITNNKIMSTTVRRSKYTISTLPPGNFCSVASLIVATLYEENPDKKHKLLNIA